jgi:DNA modification methylase
MIAEPIRPLAVPCADLVLDPANARRHPEANLEAIKGSLRAYGQRKPVVVNRRTGTVEAGNGTLQAALALGRSYLAVVYVDDDPVTAAGFSIADNRTSELAEWDRDALDRLLAEVKTDDPLLGRVLADLAASVDKVRPGRADPNEVPKPPDEPLTRPNDLWLLGEHRLLCGDAGRAEDIDRLLGGASAQLLVGNPPCKARVQSRPQTAFAAGLSPFAPPERHDSPDPPARPGRPRRAGNRPRAKDRPLAKDFVPGEEYDRLLRACFGNLARVLLPGHAYYLWGGYTNVANYPPALRSAGLYFSQAIIWVKEHPALTRQDFMRDHEWCLYGWKEGAAHRFFGPGNATDVWSVPNADPQSMVHLTEKPVALAVRALQYSSRPGENVLDPFAGSGSTLIAAEQAGRRAFLLEIDRHYCDIIVRRWERFTGRAAEREAAAR